MAFMAFGAALFIPFVHYKVKLPYVGKLDFPPGNVKSTVFPYQ